MKSEYNYEVGKIYDTIFFIVTSLFEEEMMKRLGENLPDDCNLEKDMHFYYELKSKPIKISKKLMPFCYCDYSSDVGAYLNRFIVEYIDFENGTFNTAIDWLSDQSLSKKDLINAYFPALSNQEKEDMFKSQDIEYLNNIIVHSTIHEKYQSSFLTLLLTYNSATQTLIQTFKDVYAYIDRLHNDNNDIINGIINQLNDNKIDAKSKLKRYCALTGNKPHIYMFSLINPYGILFLQTPYHYPFKIGEKFLSILSYNSNYKHITHQSFAKMIASDTRYEIFKMFYEYNELSAADISHCLHLTKSTVYAHLEDMLAERLLCHSGVSDSKYYYTIDEIYLLKYVDYMVEQNKKYMRLKRSEGIKHYYLPRKKRKDAQE